MKDHLLFLFGMALSVPIALACTWTGQLAQNPNARPLLWPPAPTLEQLQ